MWDVASDTIRWSGNVACLFEDLPPDAVASGSEFSKFIEPAQAIRANAVRNSSEIDRGEGVRYQIEYGVRARASAPVLWIEETGRWFAGRDGKPARAQGIVRVDNERHARDEQLLKISRHDALTGELNRTQLMAALAEATEEAMRFRSSFAFMLVGIDHIAHINEAFGFDVADEVVVEMAKRIRARLRSADVLARFSGDKFAIILKNCTADEMTIASERFLTAVRNDVVPTKSGPVSLTVSIGTISVPRHARNAEEATARAREALEMATNRRRGSFLIWRPDVERDARRRVNIRTTDEIVSALNDRRLILAYEPVVDTRARAPVFHECLVRMTKNDGTLLSAPDIVPGAEKLGLIHLVDQRMLELVVAELVAAPHIRLSLNISPETAMDPEWRCHIEALLRANPAVAERLIVEITETVAIQDVDDVRGFVNQLKGFGSKIAIDDFGAGNTSFRNLRRLGVDILKIDGAFIRNIARSSDDRAFVQTLIDLAQRLDIKTVAEWVQDEESVELLRNWGCDYIQGQLIGLATPVRPWDTPPQDAKMPTAS